MVSRQLLGCSERRNRTAEVGMNPRFQIYPFRSLRFILRFVYRRLQRIWLQRKSGRGSPNFCLVLM
jgi:hypothetical protein